MKGILIQNRNKCSLPCPAPPRTRGCEDCPLSKSLKLIVYDYIEHGSIQVDEYDDGWEEKDNNKSEF